MSPKKKEAKKQDKKDQEDRLLAALSYVFILGLIPYISEKKDDFTRFHMRQGLALFVIWLVVTLGLALLSFIFSPIGYSAVAFFHILIRLLLLAYVVIMVIWFYYAWKGEKKEIAFVANILKKVGI